MPFVVSLSNHEWHYKIHYNIVSCGPGPFIQADITLFPATSQYTEEEQ
jgi:hypothetical protein